MFYSQPQRARSKRTTANREYPAAKVLTSKTTSGEIQTTVQQKGTRETTSSIASVEIVKRRVQFGPPQKVESGTFCAGCPLPSHSRCPDYWVVAGPQIATVRGEALQRVHAQLLDSTAYALLLSRHMTKNGQRPKTKGVLQLAESRRDKPQKHEKINTRKTNTPFQLQSTRRTAWKTPAVVIVRTLGCVIIGHAALLHINKVPWQQQVADAMHTCTRTHPIWTLTV